MARIARTFGLAPAFSGALLMSSVLTWAGPLEGKAVSREIVLKTIKRAVRFMENTVSNRGGFLSVYTSDLSEQWGEIPARKSQVWVQEPGTVSVGRLMLDTYRATGDKEYLDFAKRAADILIYGQHRVGGWHYFIDFDPQGISDYYKNVASQCWGFEEFYHYHDNCTFDDGVHTGATRFLLDLYLETLDPVYRISLDKALDFVLISQYPNGAWPQRYPLYDDYTSFYTFNDEVISSNISLLLYAYEKLGDPRYLKAAFRGMDFVLLAQLPPPQAGWALQYDHDMKPAKARNFEPASVCSGQTVRCIQDLESFYKITGNRNFLRGVPEAIKWLEESILNEGQGAVYMGVTYTHASFYELGTNRPLYPHRVNSRAEFYPNDPMGGYYVDSELGNFTQHYGEAMSIDLEPIKEEFARIWALSPVKARAEYEEERTSTSEVATPTCEEIMSVIDSLDRRGAWVEQMFMKYYPDFRDKAKGRTIQAIQVSTFEKNIRTLIAALGTLKKK